METVADAVAERATRDRPSRLKSFLAASVVGFTAATMTYRLLRRGADSETEADEDEAI
jgi:hypothetical protein